MRPRPGQGVVARRVEEIDRPEHPVGDHDRDVEGGPAAERLDQLPVGEDLGDVLDRVGDERPTLDHDEVVPGPGALRLAARDRIGFRVARVNPAHVTVRRLNGRDREEQGADVAPGHGLGESEDRFGLAGG